MPGPKDALPDFVSGQDLTAAQLQQVVSAIRGLMPLQPGGFVSSTLTVQRPVVAGASVVAVAITETIPGATWDKVTKKKKADPVEFPIWYGHNSGDANTETFDLNAKERFRSLFAKEVKVTSGKFRVGLVLDGILFNVDCTELDMPA